ncbi:MAG TPA: AI-2E family transporter [Anaeromyxobacter sp.]|nr:AI-2E family transporter [Anaeromyxobacter sp.]
MADLHARRLLLALVLLALALAAVIVKPFWMAFFMAAVVAAALRRPMEWLARRMGGRRNLAAAVLTVGVLLLAVLPFAGLGAILVKEVIDGIEWVRTTVQSEGARGLIERLPGPVQDAANEILRAIPQPQQQLQRLAGQQGGQAAAAVGGFLAATGTLLFQVAMMLIALFFFLVDGARLVGWIDARVPLRPGQLRALLEDFRQTSVSVLVASVGTAAIQTAVALVGYLVARAPNVAFLTLATFVLALVPAVGGAVMVVAVALLLLATGHPLAGGFLAIWGVAVVSLSDNFARPYLLKGGMALHGGLVFFALLGGLAVFGAIGLVLGPMILTFLVAVLRLYRSEFAPEVNPPPGPHP